MWWSVWKRCHVTFVLHWFTLYWHCYSSVNTCRSLIHIHTHGRCSYNGCISIALALFKSVCVSPSLIELCRSNPHCVPSTEPSRTGLDWVSVCGSSSADDGRPRKRCQCDRCVRIISDSQVRCVGEERAHSETETAVIFLQLTYKNKSEGKTDTLLRRNRENTSAPTAPTNGGRLHDIFMKSFLFYPLSHSVLNLNIYFRFYIYSFLHCVKYWIKLFINRIRLGRKFSLGQH